MDSIKAICGKSYFESIMQYILVSFICLICMYYVLDLSQFNIQIPYVYNGDGLSTGLFIKGMIENGWYNVNPYLGAPFGLQMYDYPLGGDNFQYLIMKIISFVGFNHIEVMNLYYLLTYLFCAITCFAVLKYYKINIFLAISTSLLFTFLPYHILRTGHLFLLGYYIVPAVVMVILWVVHKENFILQFNKNNKRKYSIIFDKFLLVSVVICLIAGATGAYYAFFSCFFLFAIGFLVALREKKKEIFFRSLIMTFIICISLAINISPSIYYKIHNTESNSTSSRNFEASEIYGLKITQLLLPTTNHNIEWIKQKKDEYNNRAPLVNENDTSSLGLIGSIGFLLLLSVLFFRPKINGNLSSINKTLGELNILAILLGTIGGFGTLFAALISSQIRSYNRISIFIAFFSFLFLALNLQQIINRYHFKYKKIIMILVSTFIASIGIIDQASSSLVPSRVISEEFNSDKEFIKQISKTSNESMIFQIPYVSFPEGETIQQMGNYDLLKGYMHSDKLHWSFGNMKGSFADRWMKEIVKLPIKDAINIISIVGFNGIYIDRYGYSPEFLSHLENEIYRLTKKSPIESKNGRLAYYDISEYSNAISSNLGAKELNGKRNELISNIQYEEIKKIKGEEKWSFLKSDKGYKIVQSSAFSNLPENQLNMEIKNFKEETLSFDDQFSSANKYSYRHWENPKKLVISLGNIETGWTDDYIPNEQEINDFFRKRNYKVSYTSNHSLSLNE